MSRSLHGTTHFALSQRPVSTSHGVWPPQIPLGTSPTPVPDQVLYASDETVSCEGFPKGKIDIKQLAQPLVQGAELPDHGGGDETERNRYLWYLLQSGGNYVIYTMSKGIMQSCSKYPEDSQPGSLVVVGSDLNGFPCEKYNL